MHLLYPGRVHGQTQQTELSCLAAFVAQGLAKSIAWDGEGATCLMEVEVTGAKSADDARVAAKSVAGSSLVKSAIFGHDPNWGRIAAAAGYSGGCRPKWTAVVMEHQAGVRQ